MKTISTYFAVALSILCAFATPALADVSVNDSHSKSLAQALVSSLIFAAVGMVAVFFAVVVFDKATPRIDIQKELRNHNVAVAIVTGAVVIGVSIIVAASII